MTSWTRRSTLGGLTAFAAAPALAAVGPSLVELEKRSGGRLGVYVSQAGRTLLSRRSDEPFPMCSTFKLSLAAMMLNLADRGIEDLQAKVRYGKSDLLNHAPVTSAHLAEGGLSVKALAQAAVEVSDNTAANLLLARIGGPEVLTAWWRSMGDRTSRLDRPEPELNEVPVGDPRDSTTPRAMAATLETLLLSDKLKPASKTLLLGWMKAATPGLKRVRGGLPKDWSAGDKSGTGPNGEVNDIAILYPPKGRPPVLAVVYLARGKGKTAALEAIHADIGRLIAARAA